MAVIAGGRIIGSAPHYRFADSGDDNPKGLIVEQEALSGTKALRQGVLYVELERAAGEADATWDGNPDCAIKVRATTEATGNASGEGAIRGIDVLARNEGTEINWVNGMSLSVQNNSGSQASSLTGMSLIAANYGGVADSIVGLDINLVDEDDTGPHTTTGILVRNSDTLSQDAADSALKLSHTSTNGFDAMLEAATDSGDGVSTSVNGISGNTTHALVIKITVTVFYRPFFSASSW